ncbi:MAG: type II toxin-antitoxin system HigB family toxin [Pyrinomonadaceae bacterium]
MKLIGRNKITTFINEKSDSKRALNDWVTIIQEANWKNSVEMKLVYKKADLVGNCTVFDIRGNNYRLITAISYKLQIIEVLYILTRSEYDRNKWKKDCDC